jgi:putative glutamine amidotransferase
VTGHWPLVAVGPYPLPDGRVTGWHDDAEGVPVQYLAGLRRAGAAPVAVSRPEGMAAADLLARFDGLVLIGGADVDPRRYGEEAHPKAYGFDEERDAGEIELVRAAIAAHLPILAICRGVQTLNVALGGTLWQHLPDLDTGVAHGVPFGEGGPARHSVTVEPGSRLAKALGGVAVVEDCVSIHHQAAREVAPGLVVTGRSPDGMIEALETAPDAPGWCLALQWHPERSAGSDPAQQALFDAFAAAAGG